jgi:hypothetical protein
VNCVNALQNKVTIATHALFFIEGGGATKTPAPKLAADI